MNKLLSIIVLGVLFLGVNCQADNSEVSNTKEEIPLQKINTDEENTQDLIDTIDDSIPDVSDLIEVVVPKEEDLP